MGSVVNINFSVSVSISYNKLFIGKMDKLCKVPLNFCYIRNSDVTVEIGIAYEHVCGFGTDMMILRTLNPPFEIVTEFFVLGLLQSVLVYALGKSTDIVFPAAVGDGVVIADTV